MKLFRPPQLSRRALQVAVLMLTVLIPVMARYANYLSARQLEKVAARMEGSVQGRAIDWVDRGLHLLVGVERAGSEPRGEEREDVMLAARTVRGSTWSLELFGMTLTDPLAALESVVASRSARRVLLVGAALPLLGTILLGRFFCSWICPAGFLFELAGKLRGVLRFLELRPGRAKLWYGDKYLILSLGLVASLVVGLPLLGYLYPPALVGREVHNGVTMMFDRAEEGLVGFSAAGLTMASWLLVGIATAEVAFGARMWCRSLCPGGALYAALGALRIVRVRRDEDACTKCGACVTACEMGLSPMIDRIGVECDNCGKCVASCGDDALHLHLSLPRRKELA